MAKPREEKDQEVEMGWNSMRYTEDIDISARQRNEPLSVTVVNLSLLF